MGSTKIAISLLKRLIQDHRYCLATVDDEIEENISSSDSIRREIRNMEKIILERRSKLAALSKRLTNLRENRENISNDIVSLLELVPKTPGLPNEVLLQIFGYTVDIEEDERRGLAMERKPYNLGTMPLVISGVCKQWRKVVLASSSLWRYVNLTVEEEDNRLISPGLEHWLKYGLVRSRELSLGYSDMDLDEIPPFPFFLTTDWQRPLKYPRIEISYEKTDDTSGWWPDRYGSADEVVLLSSGSEFIWSFFRVLCLQAKKLVLSRIVLTPWSKYAWRFLTDLTIVGVPRDTNFLLLREEIMDLFTSVHHLSKVFIEWDPMCTDDSPAGHYSPVIHPQLRSLTCSFDAIELYLHPLQELVTFPNLTELIFHTITSNTSRFLPGWLVALRSIRPFPLRHLQLPDLSRPSVDLDDILPIFSLLPGLERLILTGSKLDALLQRLIIGDMESDAPTILPSLTRLDIRDSDVTDKTLERLIISRLASNRTREGVRGMEVVNIYESPGITPKGWQRILVLLSMAKK